jgi:Glycosyltransferase family 87
LSVTRAAPSYDHPPWQIVALSAGALLIVLGLAWWLTGLPGSGTDYYFTFRPLALSWLAGATRLYDGPLAQGFLHPPWTLAVAGLFAAWPYRIGLVMLTAVSLLMLAAGAWEFSQPGHGRPLALAFALFNLHTFDLLYRGQLSGMEVGGLALGWLAYRRQAPWLMGLAYGLMMIVPPNTIPAALFLAYLSWHGWPGRKVALSLVLPAAIGLASFVVFGMWPLRWLASAQANPLQPYFLTTLWRAAEQLALPLLIPWAVVALVVGLTIWAGWRAGRQGGEAADLTRLMLIVSATLVITPYSLSYRLVLLVACVLPFLSRWRLDVLLGLYALTFLPLLRLIVGRDNAWIDFGFVIVTFAAVVIYAALHDEPPGALEV